METEQAQAMLENRNIDKQKMLKQIKSLIEENEKNIAKLSDENMMKRRPMRALGISTRNDGKQG